MNDTVPKSHIGDPPVGPFSLAVCGWYGDYTEVFVALRGGSDKCPDTRCPRHNPPAYVMIATHKRTPPAHKNTAVPVDAPSRAACSSTLECPRHLSGRYRGRHKSAGW